MKKIILWVLAIATILFAYACSAGTAGDPAAQDTAAVTASAAASAAVTADAAGSSLLELTLDELKQYDGKNGNPAYVAVDGVIYDVSNLPKWKNGEHNGYSAGNDLTDVIKNKSPHGVKKLEGVPVVGKLVEG